MSATGCVPVEPRAGPSPEPRTSHHARAARSSCSPSDVHCSRGAGGGEKDTEERLRGEPVGERVAANCCCFFAPQGSGGPSAGFEATHPMSVASEHGLQLFGPALHYVGLKMSVFGPAAAAGQMRFSAGSSCCLYASGWFYYKAMQSGSGSSGKKSEENRDELG